MKRITFYLAILISQSSIGQTFSDQQVDAFQFVDSLIKKEDLVFQNNDLVFPKEIQGILLKVQKSMAENKTWFEDYFNKNYKEGEGLPYDEKFGVTREEYELVKNLDKTPPKLTPIAEDTITALKKNDRLTFKSKGSLKIFDLLEIDFKTRTVLLGMDTIPYSNKINASSTTPFGKWHGYSWKYEKSNQTDNFKIDELESEIIEISFGRTFDNKILVLLKAKKVDKGTIKANIDVIEFVK